MSCDLLWGMNHHPTRQSVRRYYNDFAEMVMQTLNTSFLGYFQIQASLNACGLFFLNLCIDFKLFWAFAHN